VKELKGFQGIYLEPGESKTVSFDITVDDLSFIGMENKPIIEPGEFEISIGNLKSIFSL